MAPPAQIDPNTGERIPAATGAQIDPATGERVQGAATTPPQPSWWDRVTAPYTEIQKPDPNHPWAPSEAAKAVGNIGAGGLGVLLHPLNTIEGMGKLALDANPVGMAYHAITGTPSVPQQMFQQFRDNPMGTIEAGIGQAGAAPFLEAEGKVATAPARIIPKVARGGMDILAGTTPKVTAELAQDAAAKNAAAASAATEANAKAAAQRGVDLQKHFDKVMAARGDTGTPRVSLDNPSQIVRERTPQELQSHKAALERGVEQLDPKFQDDLKATEKNVRQQAGAKYDAVRAATAGETVPSSSLADAVKQAETNIKGSTENLKIFRDILSKHPESDPDFVQYQGAEIPKGHPLYDVLTQGEESPAASFSDLQGYYSELGNKLAQGNLPSDVYLATKSLQNSIGDLMQNMAESKGVGADLTDARSFYRDYMNSFRDSKSPLSKAMKATEAGQAIKQFQGKDQSGVQTLARYNPDLAKRANTIRGYQAEAKSIPSREVTPKPEPTLAPKPAPVQPEVKTISPEDIRQAKTNVLLNTKRTGGLAGSSLHGAGVWHLVQSAVHGSPEGVLGGAALAATPYAMAKLFKMPAVVRILSEPTPADIATIPPELRANMPQIVKAAQAQGIKVHPALLTMGGSAARPAQ